MEGNIQPQNAAFAPEDKEIHKGPEQQDIARVVQELLQRSKRASADLRKKIPDNYKFFVEGKQWSLDRPAWRFSETVNTSLGTMLQEVGIQTDGRPKTDFAPQEPTDTAFVDVLKEVNDRNWSRGLNEGFGWANRLEEHIFESKYSDWSWAEVCWDPSLSPPLGDIGWRKLNPVYCYWDPLATNIYELRWFIYIEPVPTKTLQALHPDKKDQIKSDVKGMESGGTERRDYNIDREWLVAALEGGEGAAPFEKEDQYGGEDMTLKIRCWLRDSAVEEVTESKELGDETVTKMKYPKGRYVEMAGACVLEDHENGVKVGDDVYPYEDGLFPVAMLRNYSLPGKIEGLSEAPFLRGPQKITNYVWSFILDSMKMAGNPKVTVTPEAGEIVDDITNEPGAVFEVPKQDSIMFHEGKGIAPGMMNILEMSMGLQDKAQGQQDVSRGASQPGVTSGLMMEGFVEAAQTRPRLKNRNVDQFLTQVGTLMLSRIMQFYTAPRVMRITGEKAEGYPEHLEFYMSKDEAGNDQANVTPMAMAEGRKVAGSTQKIAVTGKPDVIVQSGSALPYGRAQKQAMAGEQLRMGAIDIETYLEDVGRTDTKQVLQRLQEQAAAQQPPEGGA